MNYEYYEILEITPSASLEEIKQAYKKLALKYHPDKHKQRLDSTSLASIHDKFILINEAYSVLAHEESRARYDYLRSTGKTLDQDSIENFENEIDKINWLMRKLFREIMAKKERIIELSELFESFAISMGWITENENKLFGAFEKEILSFESNILEENIHLEQAPSETSISDSELITHYIPDDDIVQIMGNPQWVLIDKEPLILSRFAESYMLLIKSITIIVTPLMMACTYGTWGEEKIDLLQRVATLMSQITQYLEFIKTKTDEEEFEPIIENMKTENIQTQIGNLRNHPILSKFSNGRFGQNTYPLLSIAALLGPLSAGQSLYWSLLAVIFLSIVIVHNNEGDLESFQQFLNLFDEIVPLLNSITPNNPNLNQVNNANPSLSPEGQAIATALNLPQANPKEIANKPYVLQGYCK